MSSSPQNTFELRELTELEYKTDSKRPSLINYNSSVFLEPGDTVSPEFKTPEPTKSFKFHIPSAITEETLSQYQTLTKSFTREQLRDYHNYTDSNASLAWSSKSTWNRLRRFSPEKILINKNNLRKTLVTKLKTKNMNKAETRPSERKELALVLVFFTVLQLV